MQVKRKNKPTYFEWLYSQIAPLYDENPRHSYWQLSELLYRIPFENRVPNDDNRYSDGINLRNDYVDVVGHLDDDSIWKEYCSVFEMLIALAIRASFETGDYTDLSVQDWYWTMLAHLGIDRYNDEFYDDTSSRHVKSIISRFNNRSYKPNGEGGLFPLKDPKSDQRDVEIWYQLSSYILENTSIID